MLQGHNKEQFLSAVRLLSDVHPNLSLAQIVASKFAIVPDLIPITQLSSRVGKVVNIPGESRIETERRSHRRYFIIRHNLIQSMVYLYEITGEQDPTRGWSSLDPKSRLSSRYPTSGSTLAQRQQSFLKKYHTSRFFGAGEEESILVGNSVHIDMTAFQDPTEGTDWSPGDFPALAKRKKWTGGRYSWHDLVGEFVDEMFDTKRQTLTMMYANRRGYDVSKRVACYVCLNQC